MTISAIILAAGSSTRMGDVNKLLCPLNNSSILEQSLLHLVEANINEIIIVLGHEADKISTLPLVKKLISEGKVSTSINKEYTNGMGSSLAMGIKTLSDKTDACIIALADMPYIKPNTIIELINASRKEQTKQIFIPQHEGQNGNPILWKSSLFNQLVELSGDTGGKNIIRANESLSQIVNVDDLGILKDVDTPEMLGA